MNRIEEIAAWLPAEPKADGARIGDRTAWERLAALPEAAAVIAEAQELAGLPMPVLSDERYLDFTRNGNRSEYERPYFERGRRLDVLLLAECLENKGRFLHGIVECATAICDERTWTAPAHDDRLTAFHGRPHVELFSAERCLKLARTLDWLRGVLPGDVALKIAGECDRRVFQPYLLTARNAGDKAHRDDYPWHGWFEAGLNWSSVCHSCVVRAALAIIPDRLLRAEFIAAAESSLPVRMKEGFLSDGYCTEGMTYWNYGYGHHAMMGLSVRAATAGRVDLFADPKNRKTLEYAYGFQLEKGRSPSFADGVGNPSLGVLALMRQVFPDLYSRDVAGLGLFGTTDGSRVWPPLSIMSLRAFGQEPVLPADAGPFDELPPRTWFPAAQVLISRAVVPGVGGRLSIAVKGGTNAEFHNHNDLGSYTVMLDGVEMGGDPGREIYTRDTFSDKRYQSPMMGSYGHPVPVVGGKFQREGCEHAAAVLRTVFSYDRDEIIYDLSKGYELPALMSLERRVAFDRRTSAIEIEDTVEFAEPCGFEVPFVTYRNLAAEGGPGRFVIRHPEEGRSLSLEVTASAPFECREEKIENPGLPSVTRLGFSISRPARRAAVKFTLAAR